MNCERCDKLGFDKCHCAKSPNNYTLHISNDTTTYSFQYLKAAIVAGMLGNEPFTVNLVSPEMVVCYWQPGMAQVAYNRYYEDYIMDCQRNLQGVMG